MSCGDSSSLLAEMLTKCYSSIFGKKIEEFSAERDKELPPQLMSSLRQCCDQMGAFLLPNPTNNNYNGPSSLNSSFDASKRRTARR
jgi:hypothetical protein